MAIVITSDTDSALKEFKILLKVRSLSGTHFASESEWIARRLVFDAVEIYHNTQRTRDDPEGYRHGMRLFVRGECTVHLQHATCGYNGSGTIFTEQALALLGISVDMHTRYDVARARLIRFRKMESGMWTSEILELTDTENLRQAEGNHPTARMVSAT